MSASIADILQDSRAFAAACEELAEHLDATVEKLKSPSLLNSQEMDFLRVLPLMCAFASSSAMADFVTRLRAIATRLDALPTSADELARVLAAPEDEFARFEALLFDGVIPLSRTDGEKGGAA